MRMVSEASGAFPVTLPCPAPPRTKLTPGPPCYPEAVQIFQEAGLLVAPAKAANAGGVATSGLEMSQNSMRYSWTFEEVDHRLKDIMANIFQNIYHAAEECGKPGDLVVGANLAAFKKVADSMLTQGLI